MAPAIANKFSCESIPHFETLIETGTDYEPAIRTEADHIDRLTMAGHPLDYFEVHPQNQSEVVTPRNQSFLLSFAELSISF